MGPLDGMNSIASGGTQEVTKEDHSVDCFQVRVKLLIWSVALGSLSGGTNVWGSCSHMW